MKKWTILILLLCSLFLCSCSEKKLYQNLEFPGPSWKMNMREVLNALNMKKEDVSAASIIVDGRSSTLRLEGYELFGAKTKYVGFSFYDFTKFAEEWPERNEAYYNLLDEQENDGKEGFLDLIAHHKFLGILVMYPKHTDMDNVFTEMKKIYGKPLPALTSYEENGSFHFSPKPKEYKDSEQIKVWGSDCIAAFIPKNESEAYQNAWKKYYIHKGMVDAENGVPWNTFTQTARMQSILCQNEKDCKQLLYSSMNACVYEILFQQISQ